MKISEYNLNRCINVLMKNLNEEKEKITRETQKEVDDYILRRFEKEHPELCKAYILLKASNVGNHNYHVHFLVKNNVRFLDLCGMPSESSFSDLTLEVDRKRKEIDDKVKDLYSQLTGIIRASPKKELLEKFPELKEVFGESKDSKVCTSLACITDLRTQLKLDKDEKQH